MVNKRKHKKRQDSKRDKPPVGRDKEVAVLLWLMSHGNEDVEKRIFDEWSYTV